MAVAEFTLARAPASDRRNPVRYILSHVGRHVWLVVIALIGAFGNAALAAVVPIMIGRAFDLVLSGRADLPALAQLAAVIIVSQTVRGVLQLGRNFGAELIGQRLERDIRGELYVSLLGKSMTFHNLQPVGDTMARATNDVREINLMFNPGLNLVIGSGNFLLMPLLIAPSIHPVLLLTPFLFLIAYAFSLWHYLRELRPVTEAERSAFGRMNTRLAETIDGIEVVKGAATEREETAQFEGDARQFREAFVRRGRVEARFLPLLLLGLATGAAFLQSILLFNQGQIEVGDVVAYVGLISLFGFPTFVSLFAYSQVSLGMASAARILELINRQTELDQNVGGHAGPVRGKIEFRRVGFAHPGATTGLQDLSFRLEPGQTVAIVGQTGSGKTTLAKLVNRTYDVAAGQVLVDGIDVRRWDLASLRAQISMIEQDVFLFSRTISENIAFGRPGAVRAEIEAAAKAAQAHEFILAFQDGYDTMVGERGVTLSGGQRQRLALARAFLTDPRILILDDSTSSIDSATEDEIQQAIFRAAQGRTTLIITHRLSQIRWADQILVLRQGRLAAAGSHDELMRTAPAYRRIFERYGDEEG
ncbi:MAG TPA: ABC transporter ATP-binding protein [Anaerolineales bacterium]|nr:ABC transporter ATP-binding protein [Anaerolineales bacterium]